MGKKLDLSKLSEEEAKHVWDVVQRDINLRKIEEERIEDLKEKVEKESSKRELLSNQSHLNETHCMHCLQPFQFLINSKRQCKDCQFHVCKNCSRYNKKELGWVCDSCRVDRLVKVGSLDWYYDHVRSRFKRFGSAKVMRSLYMRHQSDARGASGLQNKVYSLPDINREYLRQARAGMFHDEDEDLIDSAEAQRYNMMRKTKRKLSVHPYDFDMDSEYSTQSRRQSMQLSPTLEQDVFKSFSERPSTGRDATSQKESLIAEADLASMFHHILQEQGQNAASPEQEFSTEVRLTVNSRRLSLENTRRPKLPFLTESQISNHFPDPQLTRTRYLPKGSPSLAPKGSQYSGDMDTSDEEGGAIPKVPPRRRSRASSQENVHHSGGQISDLNKRMSTIERMLNRLEERLSVNSDESTGPGVHTDADIEEETLKRKLGELASNISDKGGSSDEEKISKPKSSHKEPQTTETQKRSAAQALTDITAKTLRTINATERVIRDALGGDFQRGPPNISQPRVSREAQGEFQSLEEDVYMAAEKAYTLDKNLRDLEERARQSGTTDSELSELEVSVASAIAQVQQTESEVSDIESRIAALSAAGMTVSPVDKAKRKSSSRVFAPAISRSTEPFQESTPDMYSMSSPSDAKILAMQQALRKKFNIDPDAIDLPVEKSALYRGSLTQRNPNGKNRKADRIFSKPIVNQR
ncbi:melanophilin isoform X1 [Xenopus tropicalis]|uniref:Melanophilin isoform X1 n=1 Tax=Xenopus tropicalis TaxID=8364 RepID=A0A8J0SWT5_XENTR|nr:melanophilin isoform X1 [Xenopus tropicalis]